MDKRLMLGIAKHLNILAMDYAGKAQKENNVSASNSLVTISGVLNGIAESIVMAIDET